MTVFSHRCGRCYEERKTPRIAFYCKTNFHRELSCSSFPLLQGAKAKIAKMLSNVSIYQLVPINYYDKRADLHQDTAVHQICKYKNGKFFPRAFHRKCFSAGRRPLVTPPAGTHVAPLFTPMPSPFVRVDQGFISVSCRVGPGAASVHRSPSLPLIHSSLDGYKCVPICIVAGGGGLTLKKEKKNRPT